MSQDAPPEPERNALQDALSHASGLFTAKVGELSLIREVAECAAHLEHPEQLGAAIANAVQTALQVDACALFARHPEHGWGCLGACALDPLTMEPRHVADGLLDMAGEALGGVAFAGGRNGTPQVALELRLGRQLVGALVITDGNVTEVHGRHGGLLAILCPQVANLVFATRLLARVGHDREHLEGELERRSRLLHQAEEALHQREKLASLGQLLTGVSHEVNNRLVPILGYAQLLTRLDLPDRAARAVASIEHAALGCRQTVEDLLAFGRPEQPKLAACALPDVLGEVIAGFSADGRPAPVRMQVDGEAPPALVDAHQMEQVFHNLIKNALEAVEGRPEGNVRVTVRGGARVEVVVEDNGRGMPDEIRRRAFEPFFTTKQVGRGTGLGLSLSYGLVQANGGQIDVESREGIGSRFTVSFPAAHTGTQAAPAAPAAPIVPKEIDDVHPSNSTIKRKVLVVDDENDVREFLVQALEPRYDVTAASDAAQARAAMEAGGFDVVLLDLRLPDDGGPRLVEWVRAKAPAALPRVVFMTGDTHDPEAARFLAGQPNQSLSKPFTIEELTRTLERAAR
jgi:signal transduction histidine kinase/CheY-like chemotaxis protein